MTIDLPEEIANAWLAAVAGKQAMNAAKLVKAKLETDNAALIVAMSQAEMDVSNKIVTAAQQRDAFDSLADAYLSEGGVDLVSVGAAPNSGE